MRYANARTVTLVIAATLLAGGYWYAMRPAAPPRSADKVSQPAASVKRAAWFAPVVVPSRLPDPDHRLALQARIAQLAASSDPADAFKAYQLVQSCIEFEAERDAPPADAASKTIFGLRNRSAQEKADAAALCAGMTERIKADRIGYLAIAAKAGVPAADFEFMRAGPFGDPSALQTRPDDPLVQAWKAQAIAQLRRGADQGEFNSIMLLYAGYQSCSGLVDKDPALALGYAVALGQIFDAMSHKSGSGFPHPFDATNVNKMASGLTPQQIAEAQAAGARMAQKTTDGWQPP